MDCQTTLIWLEAVRPDSDDLSHAEFAAVSAHLEACAQCADTYRRRLSDDRRISQVLCSVEVPTELQDDLLNVLAKSGCGREESSADGVTSGNAWESPNVQKADGVSRNVPGRRQWLRQSVGIVACLIGGVLLWRLVWPGGEVLELESVREMAQRALAGEAAGQPFDDNFLVALPDSGWNSSWFGSPSQGITHELFSEHFAASRHFSIWTGRRTVNGVLLAVPVERLRIPPEAGFFHAGRVVYVRGVATVAWREGNLLFVCGVRPDDLDDLLRALENSGLG